MVIFRTDNLNQYNVYVRWWFYKNTSSLMLRISIVKISLLQWYHAWILLIDAVLLFRTYWAAILSITHLYLQKALRYCNLKNQFHKKPLTPIWADFPPSLTSQWHVGTDEYWPNDITLLNKETLLFSWVYKRVFNLSTSDWIIITFRWL